MRDSLRATLLLWYTVILTLVIAASGVAVCYLFWQSMLRDLDADLLQQAESVARALRPAPSGTFDLELTEEHADYFSAVPDHRPYYAIWDATGNEVDRSDPEVTLAPPAEWGLRSRAGRREVSIRADGGATVLVGRPLTELQGEVLALAGTVGIVGALALGVSLLGGWWLVGRALTPIARMSRTASAMSAGNLSARIPIDRTETELGQVAAALNDAFDRLQLVVERQKRFTADASHELRTPLATFCAAVEWALARERSPSEYRESLETCQRAAVRMRGVVEGLLTLARADAGELQLQRTPVALRPLIEEVVGFLRPLAEERQVTVSIRDNDAVVVDGDPDRLREAVANLVANAIHYNYEGGRVAISMRAAGADGLLEIADTGRGIPPDELPHIFDRFYRADTVRDRRRGGTGLGLAITKWIVNSHGGGITCASELGSGSRFLVRLPVARQAQRPDVTGSESGMADQAST